MSLSGSQSLSMRSSNEFLPSLPGYQISKSAAAKKMKQNFYMLEGQTFYKDDNLSVADDDSSTTYVIGKSRVGTATQRPKTTIRMSQEPEVIFSFSAFYEETLLHSRLETFRVRKVTIFHYKDDGAFMIVEKPLINSGMPQGTLLKRTIVTKPDGSPYSLDEFRIGCSVEILGKTYHIYDSEPATRRYLDDDGPALQPPMDEFEKKRFLQRKSREGWGALHTRKNSLKKFIEAKLGNTVNNSGREGLNTFGHNTLKFLCIWDDTENLYGDVTEYTLIYHLRDDTIEIFAVPTQNSGKEQFPRLLKRGKLPIEVGARTLEANIKLTSKEDFHHWTNLYIGVGVFVYARNLIIVDADQSTRDFYMKQEMPLAPSQMPETNKPPRTAKNIPPHSGFGSDEDSLQSCIAPLANTAPPKKRFGENKVLSFVCKFITKNFEDINRRFVITYFITDNTIKIHEIPVKNSGFVGGVFLARGRFKGMNGDYITAKDMYIGSTLGLQRHVFKLLESNESTMRWMELHADIIPVANTRWIMDKLRYNPALWEDSKNGNLLQTFLDLDSSLTGDADKNTLTGVLNHYGINEEDICEHEVITLVRSFGNRDEKFDFRKFVSELDEPSDDDL